MASCVPRYCNYSNNIAIHQPSPTIWLIDGPDLTWPDLTGPSLVNNINSPIKPNVLLLVTLMEKVWGWSEPMVWPLVRPNNDSDNQIPITINHRNTSCLLLSLPSQHSCIWRLYISLGMNINRSILAANASLSTISKSDLQKYLPFIINHGVTT